MIPMCLNKLILLLMLHKSNLDSAHLSKVAAVLLSSFLFACLFSFIIFIIVQLYSLFHRKNSLVFYHPRNFIQLSFLHPNLFLDKDAQLVEKHKEGGDEEASHKDMMQIGKNSNLNQNGEEVENDQIVPFLGLAVFDN